MLLFLLNHSGPGLLCVSVWLVFSRWVLKDVTTKSAIKRSVSTVTDTPSSLFSVPIAGLFLAIVLYEDPLVFRAVFLGQPYFCTCCFLTA